MAKIKPPEDKISDAIRAEIEKIPANELATAKPSRVIKALQDAGWEITPSIQSMTSRILSEYRKKASPAATQGKIVSLADGNEFQIAGSLIQACGGDPEKAHRIIDQVTWIARNVRVS